jgi:hypothetical protein
MRLQSDFCQRMALRLAVLTAVFCLSVRASHATLITANQTIVAPGEPDPTGGTVLASQSANFISGTIGGTLVSEVIDQDPSNTLGGLTFTYKLTNRTTSTDGIARFTVDDFVDPVNGPFQTDVSYQTPAAGAIPTFADRDIPPGHVIGFTFLEGPLGNGKIAPGASSALLVVQTDSKAFNRTFASVIDGSIATVASYAPIPSKNVPEPGSVSLLTLGGISLALAARRRLRKV